MKPVTVRDPVNVRTAILGHLEEQGVSRYRFALECVRGGICQHHTVDELLSTTSDRLPSLPIAISLIDKAGLELVIRPKTRKASNGN